MIFFYFPHLFLLRRILWCCISASLLFAFCFLYLCLWQGTAVKATLPPVIFRDEPTADWRSKLIAYAKQSGCKVKPSAKFLSFVGSKDRVLHCAWLASLGKVPLYAYRLTPISMTGEYCWRVKV